MGERLARRVRTPRIASGVSSVTDSAAMSEELLPVEERSFPVGVLAKRTGVTMDTLRAWERRYGVPAPARSAGGHRRYTPTDAERVLWLVRRISDGQRIGAAVLALRALDLDAPGQPGTPLRTSLVRAALDGDTVGIEADLDHAFGVLAFVEALNFIVFPALEEIGALWAEGRAPISTERLLSEAVQRRLAVRLAPLGRSARPLAVIFCPSGERHEIGAMALAVVLAADDWGIAYLGADTPIEEAISLAERRQANVVVAVCTIPEVGAATAIHPAARNIVDRQFVLAGPGAVHAPPGLLVWDSGLDDARLKATEMKDG